LAVSQSQGCHVLPAAVCFANEHELLDVDFAFAGKLGPAFSRQSARRSGLFIEVRFQNRHVRDVRPTLSTIETPAAKLIVQFAQAIGRASYLNEDRRRSRQEGLDVSQFNVERDGAAACFLEKLECC